MTLLIILCILLSILSAGLTVMVAYEHAWRRRAVIAFRQESRACDILKRENEVMKLELANRDGACAGRTSDALYRGILNGFSRGEPIRILYKRNPRYFYSDK